MVIVCVPSVFHLWLNFSLVDGFRLKSGWSRPSHQTVGCGQVGWQAFEHLPICVHLRPSAVSKVPAKDGIFLDSPIEAQLCQTKSVPINHDIRWKQRFQNFDRAYVLLRQALERGPAALSMLEKEGVIQRFEYSFELAWKTIKDYLEEGGLVISPVTPRQVLKDAFAAKVIRDGQVWINMLDNRNLLSHTYNLSVFEKAVDDIAAHYLPAMGELHQFFLVRVAE